MKFNFVQLNVRLVNEWTVGATRTAPRKRIFHKKLSSHQINNCFMQRVFHADTLLVLKTTDAGKEFGRCRSGQNVDHLVLCEKVKDDPVKQSTLSVFLPLLCGTGDDFSVNREDVQVAHDLTKIKVKSVIEGHNRTTGAVESGQLFQSVANGIQLVQSFPNVHQLTIVHVVDSLKEKLPG